MGIAQFYQFQEGLDHAKAFRAAVDTAIFQEGVSGYSGTLAEKYAYRIRDQRRRILAQAEAFARRTVRETDKWEECYAVPVYSEDRRRLLGWLFYGNAPT